MNQNNSKKYLILSIVLILLACIRFEYRTEHFGLTVPGLRGATILLAIVGIVLLYQTFHSAQDVCLERGLIESPVKSRYDLLIPLTLIAVAVTGEWSWESVRGEDVYQWEFAWSDPDYNIPFLAALVVVVLLLRIRTLFKAIEAHSGEGSEMGTSTSVE